MPFLLVGFIFGSAMIKAENIWVVVFIHGVMNSIFAFVMQYLLRPDDKIYSFGLGIYGLAILAVIVMVTWHDPVWDEVKLEKSVIE